MRSKTILFIVIVCVFAGVGVRVVIDNFLDRSMESTDKSDGNEEFETFLSEMADYFKTSELTINGTLRECPLTGKNVSILIPVHYIQWGTLWHRKLDPHQFYALDIDERPYEELFLALDFKPSESQLGSYVQVSGTLTLRRIQVTDFFHQEVYVLYVEDLEVLSQ